MVNIVTESEMECIQYYTWRGIPALQSVLAGNSQVVSEDSSESRRNTHRRPPNSVTLAIPARPPGWGYIERRRTDSLSSNLTEAVVANVFEATVRQAIHENSSNDMPIARHMLDTQAALACRLSHILCLATTIHIFSAIVQVRLLRILFAI